MKIAPSDCLHQECLTINLGSNSEIVSNSERPQNSCNGTKVMDILLNGWILPTGGTVSGRVSTCSLRSRLFFYSTVGLILEKVYLDVKTLIWFGERLGKCARTIWFTKTFWTPAAISGTSLAFVCYIWEFCEHWLHVFIPTVNSLCVSPWFHHLQGWRCLLCKNGPLSGILIN